MKLRWSEAACVGAVLLFCQAGDGYGQTLLEAADTAKQTGLPLLVMFSSPTCPFCVKMKSRLQTEPDLKSMISTQYVFVETSSTDDVGKKLLQQYNVAVSGVPHTLIVSARGTLVAELSGLPSDQTGLSDFLQEGIRKTGGMKDPQTLRRFEELQSVRDRISAAKEKLTAEATRLEALVALLEIQRKYGRVTEIKQEIGVALAAVAKDSANRELLPQAKLLDTAAGAGEAKNRKVADNLYRSVMDKFPGTAAARYAQARLDEKP